MEALENMFSKTILVSNRTQSKDATETKENREIPLLLSSLALRSYVSTY